MFRDSLRKSHPLEPLTPVYHIMWVPPPREWSENFRVFSSGTFNISIQYMYVIVLVHFVLTKFEIYWQNPKCNDKLQIKGFSAMNTMGGRKDIPATYIFDREGGGGCPWPSISKRDLRPIYSSARPSFLFSFSFFLPFFPFLSFFVGEPMGGGAHAPMPPRSYATGFTEYIF